MWEGFLYTGASKVELEIPALSIGKGHGRSIYPKHPQYILRKNLNQLQSKTSVGYIQQILL